VLQLHISGYHHADAAGQIYFVSVETGARCLRSERHLAGEMATGEVAGGDFAELGRLDATAGDGVAAARMEVAT
jgi:hypothetical protein